MDQKLYFPFHFFPFIFPWSDKKGGLYKTKEQSKEFIQILIS